MIKFTVIGINDFASDLGDRLSCCTTDGTNVYVGTQNPNNGCKVLKYNGSTWSDITQNFPGTSFTEIGAIHYSDDSLLIGTGGNNTELGKGQVWRHNGQQWENLNLLDPTTFNVSIRTIGTYQDGIYAAGSLAFVYKYQNDTWSILWPGDFQTAHHTNLIVRDGTVYVSSLNVSYGADVNLIQYVPGLSNWVVRASRYLNDRLGNLNNAAISKMCYYIDHLYIATHNDIDGTEIHRLDETTGTFTKVNTSGFGNPKNYDVSDIKVIQNRVVVVTKNTTKPEIWSYTPEGGWRQEIYQSDISYASYMLIEVGNIAYLVGEYKKTLHLTETSSFFTSQERSNLNVQRFPDGTIGTINLGSNSVRYLGPQRNQVIARGLINGSISTIESTKTLTEVGYMDPILDLKSDAGEDVPYQLGQWEGTGTNYYSGGPVYKDPASGIIIMFALAKKGYWTSTGTEGTPNDYSRKYIRLAASSDSGLNWVDLGQIISPGDPAIDTTNDYISTPAIWVKDGYIYAYYAGDKNPGGGINNLSVARTLLSDFVSNAISGTVSEWKKYYNGSFTQDGLGGLSTDLLAKYSGLSVRWVHGGYVESLNKFIILFNSQFEYHSLNLYTTKINRLDTTNIKQANGYLCSSVDGIVFSAPERIHTNSEGCKYLSLISNTIERGDTGNEFYLVQFAANEHLYTLWSENFYTNLTMPRFLATVNQEESEATTLEPEIYSRLVHPRWAQGWQNEVSAQGTRDARFGNNSKKIPIFPISTEQEFLTIDIPTRIEPVVAIYEDIQPFTTRVHGRKVSYFNEVYNTVWKVELGKIKEKSFGPSEWDIYAEYDIKDLTVDEERVYGTYVDDNVTITPLFTSLREDKLYIVTKETDYDKVNYVLKICDPREPVNAKYLESLTDFIIDVPLRSASLYGQLEENLIGMAFSEIDPNIMLLTTNLGRQLFYRLYFDYYYNDVVTNKVYFIENYPNSKIQVM